MLSFLNFKQETSPVKNKTVLISLRNSELLFHDSLIAGNPRLKLMF